MPKKKRKKAERQKCLLKLKDKGSLMLSRWNNASTRMSPVSPLAWRASSLRTLVWFSVCPNFWIDKEWPTAITEALHSIQKTNWSKAPNYFPVQVSCLHRLFERWCGQSTNHSSWSTESVFPVEWSPQSPKLVQATSKYRYHLIKLRKTIFSGRQEQHREVLSIPQLFVVVLATSWQRLRCPLTRTRAVIWQSVYSVGVLGGRQTQPTVTFCFPKAISNQSISRSGWSRLFKTLTGNWWCT